MKSLYAHGPRDLRLHEDARPDPAPGEVLVEVLRGGICGSDLHYYNHGGFGSVRLREPMILGHEISGRVIDPGHSSLSVGDLVAVSPSRPCGACVQCQKGLQNHCLNMRFYGSAMPFPHIQGAFREVISALPAQCIPAAGLTPEEATMAEPLSVVLHAVRQAENLVGKRVLVSGCGPIGLLAILAARRAGAGEIIATDITERTLALAGQVGADIPLNVAKNRDALAPWTADKGQIDVLFECSGAEVALADAIRALRPRSDIVQIGLSGDMTLPMMQITAKEIGLRGSFRFHEEFAAAVGLMQKRLIDVRPLLSHSFPLAEFREAFDTASDKSRAVKVQIVFA